jgi:uncharacterized protein (DUF488 family)
MSEVILTIGHSTRSIDELVDLLRAHGVTQLVDVRRFPGSRRHPQFNKEALARALPEAGIDYAHEEALGGRRAPHESSVNVGLRNPQFRGYADYMQTDAFRSALEHLIALSSEGTTAVMCAEAVPWRCHRSLLADALSARGQEVHHILDEGPPRPHTATKGAFMTGGEVTYPEARSGGQLRLTDEPPDTPRTR